MVQTGRIAHAHYIERRNGKFSAALSFGCGRVMCNRHATNRGLSCRLALTWTRQTTKRDRQRAEWKTRFHGSTSNIYLGMGQIDCSDWSHILSRKRSTEMGDL